MMWASCFNQRDTVNFLLQRGGSTEGVCSETGATALILAASRGYTGVVELLLQAGAEPDYVCKVGHLVFVRYSIW